MATTDLERFTETDGREELIKEVRKRIDAEGITYIYYQFISVTGRIMGKGVPATHWESMARKGFQLVYGSTANLFVDRHGEYIGYGPEAWELVGLPEPETFQQLPWDSKIARVWCTCFRNREDQEKPRGQWNRLDLYCVGQQSVHAVNGRPLTKLSQIRRRGAAGEPPQPLQRGRIQLQSEGTEVYFRNLSMRSIDALPSLTA